MALKQYESSATFETDKKKEVLFKMLCARTDYRDAKKRGHIAEAEKFAEDYTHYRDVAIKYNANIPQHWGKRLK